MDQRPSKKAIIIINLVNNIPMAIVMSVAAPLLAGEAIEAGNLMMNIGIAFVIACILNLVVPVPLIATGFPRLFHLDPEGLPGRLVGNIPVCFIFVVVIGLILTFYNVRMAPAFIFAFLATFLPLYIICFIVSMITNPIAMKLAMGTQ